MAWLSEGSYNQGGVERTFAMSQSIGRERGRGVNAARRSV